MAGRLRNTGIRILYGGLIGASAAIAFLVAGPHVLPPAISSFVEYFVLTPAKVLMLPVILTSNYWPTFSFMTAMSVIAWAIVGGLISVVLHRRHMAAPYAAPQNGKKKAARAIILLFGSVSLAAVAIIGLWIAFALLGFFGMFIGRPALNSLASPDLYQVHAITKVKFPKSAELLYSVELGWQGTELYAKAEIDRYDVEKFLRGFPGVSSTDRADFKNWKDVPWWDSDSSHKFKAAKCPLNHGEISVFVGLDRGKRVPVYISYWD